MISVARDDMDHRWTGLASSWEEDVDEKIVQIIDYPFTRYDTDSMSIEYPARRTGR